MKITRLEGCCGIVELSGIQEHEGLTGAKGPAHILATALHPETSFDNSIQEAAHVVFSTVRGTIGSRLATYIRSKRLGRVEAVTAARNPNTGANLAMWVWTPNQDALENFIEKCPACGRPMDDNDDGEED